MEFIKFIFTLVCMVFMAVFLWNIDKVALFSIACSACLYTYGHLSGYIKN